MRARRCTQWWREEGTERSQGWIEREQSTTRKSGPSSYLAPDDVGEEGVLGVVVTAEEDEDEEKPVPAERICCWRPIVGLSWTGWLLWLWTEEGDE